MTSFATKIFTKGNNYLGQQGINSKRRGTHTWNEILTMRGINMLQAEAYIGHSYILSESGKVYIWGWAFDGLTTTRILSYSKRFPRQMNTLRNWKYLAAATLLDQGNKSPRLYDFNPTNLEEFDITKICITGSSMAGLTKSGDVFTFGQDKYGILGTTAGKHSQINKIDLDLLNKGSNPTNQKTKRYSRVKDIAAGYQHIQIHMDNGSLFGSGRRHWYQYLPQELSGKTEAKDCYEDPIICELPPQLIEDSFDNLDEDSQTEKSRLDIIRSGFNHTIYINNSGKNIWATGLNLYGNCGLDNLEHEIVNKYTEVEIALQPGEKIVDVVIGKAHNLILTSLQRMLMFGNNSHKQIPHNNSNSLLKGLEFTCPIEIDIGLKPNEKIIKLKAGMNRSAIFTDFGRVQVFGETEINTKHFDDNRDGIVDYTKEFDNKIVDIGQGLLHTVVITE